MDSGLKTIALEISENIAIPVDGAEISGKKTYLPPYREPEIFPVQTPRKVG